MIHIVAGPTASGKTAKALELAAELGNAELINADSRQIYKYLDIGTNKEPSQFSHFEVIGSEEYPIYKLEGIPLHLTSFLDPDQQFNVASYQRLVFELIAKLNNAGKSVIIVGGTGLYLKAIMEPHLYQFGAEASSMRASLEQLTLAEIQARAHTANPGLFAQLNHSDVHNPIRLIRLIERSAITPALAAVSDYPKYQFKIHYLSPDINVLTDKINQRVIEMWNSGLVDEVKRVLELGFSTDAIALQGVGYKQTLEFLAGKISEQQCIKLIQIGHRQYAKRQITWFKKYLPS